MPSLEDVRQEIAALDICIIELITQRQHLAATLTHIKHQEGLPIRDEEQRRMVMERAFECAVENNIDPVSVQQIFGILVEMSEERQRECSGEGNLP